MSKPKDSYIVTDDLGVRHEATDIGHCPFCGGELSIIATPEEAAVLHSVPWCMKFEAEDPMLFLRNARMKAIGPVPDDDEYPFPIKQRPS